MTTTTPTPIESAAPARRCDPMERHACWVDAWRRYWAVRDMEGRR